ncbi:MAG TPA: hypothetical protein PKG60_06455 [Spirochaetota bacterium]|nr:hypothetical protein [Spirochaetota bacterium]
MYSIKNKSGSAAIGKRVILYLIILSALLPVLPLSLKAEDTNTYRHVLLLGIDKPVSNSEVNTPSPMIMYYYIRDDFQNDNYFQFTVTTTTVYCILGKKTESYFTGIKPVVNHTIYGAYHSYADGVNNDSRCFNGNNAGAEFFYEYFPVRYFKAGISYYPGYYWYRKKKKSDALFFKQEETEIDLPENHREHTGGLDLTIDNLEKKDLDRIRHGFIIQGSYRYTYRSGYGTFYDTAAAENSSIDKTQKRYLTAGFYYNFASDINLMLDISGAYHSKIDRNNADQIGSYVADKGVMPGYYWGEFYHNKFSIVSAQIGVPLFFWSARLQPGFNILYMPEDNDVTGTDNYPRRIYRSLSAGLSIKAGGILPVFTDYAYGIDARRLNTGSGEVKKGNHEFMFYILTAF